jgi:hypothetical protein
MEPAKRRHGVRCAWQLEQSFNALDWLAFGRSSSILIDRFFPIGTGGRIAIKWMFAAIPTSALKMDALHPAECRPIA